MRALSLLFLLCAPAAARKPRVVLETDRGSITVELEPDKAPLSSRNFLLYVDGHHYDGGSFHRTVRSDNQPQSRVKIDVIQAGPVETQEPPAPPIKLERTSLTGLRHFDGTLSMARDGPDTATGDFFICVGPQPELDFGGKRNPDGQGFAAFGRVIGGIEVARRIHALPAKEQALTPPVKILRAYRKP